MSSSFTPDQKAAVLRVRACQPTQFYEILAIERSATDNEIKKAYRKLSLLTHPDKNGFEGADEAFKMVSRAFQILSDPDKKSRYDKFGGDPDSRFSASSAEASAAAASGASPFGGFAARRGGGGSMFEEEISPEELFRQFFGGGGFGPFGMGGGMFDTGPSFVFNLGGGPGVRVHQFGGNPRMQQRRRQQTAGNGQQQQANSLLSAFFQLLPLLLLFIFPLLNTFLSTFFPSLFTSDPSTSPSIPSVRFDSPIPPHTLHRVTPKLNLDYYLNPADVSQARGYDARKMNRLDHRVEVEYVNSLKGACQREMAGRERMVQEAQGWFWQDEEMMRRARELELRSCRRLEELGVRRR